jgi:hypothetical protein
VEPAPRSPTPENTWRAVQAHSSHRPGGTRLRSMELTHLTRTNPIPAIAVDIRMT